MNRRGVYFTGWLLILTDLLLSGCGAYAFRVTNLPSEIKTVFVPIFESELRNESLRLDLKNDMTTAVRDEFGRITRLTPADEEKADSIFKGVLKRYERQVSNYDESENPTEYRITLTLQGEFRNRLTDEILWQQAAFSAFVFFPADNAKEDLGEQDAVNQLIQKAARDLVSGAVENW